MKNPAGVSMGREHRPVPPERGITNRCIFRGLFYASNYSYGIKNDLLKRTSSKTLRISVSRGLLSYSLFSDWVKTKNGMKNIFKSTLKKNFF